MTDGGARTLYVDGRHCKKQSNGGFRLFMDETLQVPLDHVAYIDDVTVTGALPNMLETSNRLYLFERTPLAFDFTGTHYLGDLSTQITITRAGDSYSTTLSISGTVTWTVDSTGLVWTGHHGASSTPCTAVYDYLTGRATWTRLDSAEDEWVFNYHPTTAATNGATPAGSVLKARTVVLPAPTQHTSATLAVALETALNQNAFQGSKPSGSGTEYICEEVGDTITLRTSTPTALSLDEFKLFTDEALADPSFPATWVAYGGSNYTAENPQSLNGLLGLTHRAYSASAQAYYMEGRVNFAGTWDSSSGAIVVVTGTGSAYPFYAAFSTTRDTGYDFSGTWHLVASSDIYVLTKTSVDLYTSTLNGVASDAYSGSAATLTNDVSFATATYDPAVNELDFGGGVVWQYDSHPIPPEPRAAEAIASVGVSLTTAGKTGTYDPSAGTVTWSGGETWSYRGHAPQRLTRELTFTTGHGHNVLYLHGGGSISGLKSRGPHPNSSTCLAKIPINPAYQVNHVSVQRAHRWIEVAAGSLSSVEFFVRDAFNNDIPLADHGANVSFSLTIAPKD